MYMILFIVVIIYNSIFRKTYTNKTHTQKNNSIICVNANHAHSIKQLLDNNNHIFHCIVTLIIKILLTIVVVNKTLLRKIYKRQRYLKCIKKYLNFNDKFCICKMVTFNEITG